LVVLRSFSYVCCLAGAAYGWSDIDVHIVADGKHYLVEERPDEVAELIERHAAGR
jgi:hypothetical protein